MVKQNLSNVVSQFKDNIQRYKALIEELNNGDKITLSKKARIQRDIYYTKSKIQHYLLTIRDFGKGNIVIIKFRQGEQIFKATYVNISIDEAIEITKLKGLYSNQQIEILESREILTSISRVVL